MDEHKLEYVDLKKNHNRYNDHSYGSEEYSKK